MAGRDDYRVLENLRAPLLAGIILVHCNVLQFIPAEEGNLTIHRAVMFYFLDLFHVTVPAFFFISGFFFYRNGLPDLTELLNKLKRRCYTLLIPYLLWNLIGLALTYVKTFPFLSSYFPQYHGFFNSLTDMLAGFVAMPNTGQPYDFPLWFLRNLIFVLTLTPILTYLFKFLKVWSLVPLLVLMILFPDFAFGITPSVWFFAMGAVCALYIGNLKFSRKYVCLWGGVYTLLTIGYYLLPDCIPATIAQSFGVIFLTGFSVLLTAKYGLLPRYITQGVFFVYACHGLYCTVISKIALSLFAPVTTPFLAITAHLTSFLLNIALTILIYYILNRSFPKLTAILSGSRHSRTTSGMWRQ